MRRLVYLLYFICSCMTAQQEENDPVEQLRSFYGSYPQLACEIQIDIDVPGMSIPRKILWVSFEEGKKPKVKGEGLSLLPKKGLINQMYELLNTEMQALFIEKQDELLHYKLVSLEKKSDWVTADIFFKDADYRIRSLEITTRKHGTFQVDHEYKTLKYPSYTRIRFETNEFKLPLKFIGSERSDQPPVNSEGPVEGIIELRYTYTQGE